MAEISQDEYMARLKFVINQLPTATERILDSNKERILDLNRETQLREKGIDSKGKKLQEYAYFTIQIKQLIGQPFNRTTLFYSGKFYEGFTYTYNRNTYTLNIYSTDKKTPLLEEKYGSDIFGLTKDNEIYLEMKILKQELDKWISSKI
jgi:hypothetical protein